MTLSDPKRVYLTSILPGTFVSTAGGHDFRGGAAPNDAPAQRTVPSACDHAVPPIGCCAAAPQPVH